MKKNVTKRDFKKFTSKNTHKRRDKDKARRELRRMVEETNTNASGAKFGTAVDFGKRGFFGTGGRYSNVAVGIFSSTKSGFGFARLESGEDVFIPRGRTSGALDGDKIEIEYSRYKDRFGEEKTEGRVKKILDFGRKTLIGTVLEELVLFGRKRRGYVLVFIPDDQRIDLRPRVEFAAGSKDGDKVEVRLNRGGAYTPTCDVIRIFGRADDFGANYQAHLAECGIEENFTEAAEIEALRVAGEPVVTDGRKDRRSEIIFTIDGAGAKDLDDAVSLRRLAGGLWQLGVHIADVSHYVRERSVLERAAMSRGTSVYFTDKVVPMLPEAISNGSCSLNAGEDKYTLSAIINISPEGELLSLKLEKSVINSKVRGVYSEVNEIFDGVATEEVLAKYKRVIPTLMRMRELYLILKKKSRTRGAVELEFSEAEVRLGTLGEPLDIVKRERKDAEMLIEQFMLAANEAVAKFLTERGIPCVYRIHEPPPEDKLEDFVGFIRNLGLDTRGIKKTAVRPSDFSHVLSEASEKGLLAPVSYTMLRSMSKARYSEEHLLHFGLGIEYYCHFTSPIRRLADLATHRIIHKVLFEGKGQQRYLSFARRAAVAASEAELRALNAERRIENMYKALYMSHFIGEEFDAVVNSVTSFGLFCELENTCEGLVPISELCGDFYFDEKQRRLVSPTVTYRLADRVRVRLEEADVMGGRLRFSVVSFSEGE